MNYNSRYIVFRLVCIGKAEYEARKQHGLLVHGGVTTVLYHDIMAVLNAVGEIFLLIHGSKIILLAGDYESWADNLVKSPSHIVVG